MPGNVYQQSGTIIIKNYTSNAAGIVSFIFGLISIFFMAPLFVPLAIVMGIIAIISRQFVWGSIGLLCASVGFLTSPILLGIVGVAAIVANLPSNKNNLQQQTGQLQYQQQALQREWDFEANVIHLVNEMEEIDSKIDIHLKRFPNVEHKYDDITAKVQAYYDGAHNVAQSGNQYAVGQIEYAMNQGRYATDQVHYEVQSLDTDFHTKVGMLVTNVKSYENSCKVSNSVSPDLNSACQKLYNAGHLFGTKILAMSESLKHLEQTYQSDYQKQGDLIMAVQNFQYP